MLCEVDAAPEAVAAEMKCSDYWWVLHIHSEGMNGVSTKLASI